MRAFTAIAAALLCGCSVSGSVAEENKLLACTDTRDGERFQFETKTMRDISIGILGAPSCATFTGTDGIVRTICSNAAPFIKCEQISP